MTNDVPVCISLSRYVYIALTSVFGITDMLKNDGIACTFVFSQVHQFSKIPNATSWGFNPKP